MCRGLPQIARDACIPDVTAASTLPPSIPLRVQSPASFRFENPDSSDRSRLATLPARVST